MTEERRALTQSVQRITLIILACFFACTAGHALSVQEIISKTGSRENSKENSENALRENFPDPTVSLQTTVLATCKNNRVSAPQPLDTAQNVQYVRGSDCDGGIGGILYTIRMNIDNSPELEYHMDEVSGATVGDSSGNNYDATLSGAIWITSYSGNCMDFDGSNDYVPVSVAIVSDSFTAHTVSLCFKADTASGTQVLWE